MIIGGRVHHCIMHYSPNANNVSSEANMFLAGGGDGKSNLKLENRVNKCTLHANDILKHYLRMLSIPSAFKNSIVEHKSDRLISGGV